MENTRNRAIKIGGEPLRIVEEIANSTFRTYKGTAEMLILLGKEKLNKREIFLNKKEGVKVEDT